MYGSGRYLCVLCFLGAGACSAGADADGATSDASLGDAPAEIGNADVSSEPPLAGADANDGEEAADQPGPGAAEEAADSPQPCTCGNPLPGVTIDADGGELTVSVDVPGASAIAIHMNGSNCERSEHGLSLSGDISVDLGGGAEIPLLDADLSVSVPGVSEIAISGTAKVGNDALRGIVDPSDWAEVRAEVSLGANASDDAQLDLTLHPTALTLDTATLPLASTTMVLDHTTIVLSASCQGEHVQFRGSLAAKASVPWLGVVPLTLDDDLAVTGWIADHELLGLELAGDLQLAGNSLICGTTRLASVPLSSAAVVWNSEGLSVQAEAIAGLHPLLSALGKVELAASFAAQAWRIKLCGDVALEVGVDALEVVDCLELSKDGLTVCKG